MSAHGYSQPQTYYASHPPGAQQPVVQLMPSGNNAGQNSRNKRKGFSHSCARACGLMQILCGIISIGTASAMLYYCTSLHFVGTGFWCGLVFLISGSVGVRSAHKKTNCMIVSAMVLCIFCIFFAGAQAGFGGVGLVQEIYFIEEKYFGVDMFGICEETYTSNYAWNIRIGLQVTLVSAAGIEFILAVTQSIVSCAGVCCGDQRQEQVVVYVPQPQQQQGEIPYSSQPASQSIYPGAYPGARPSLTQGGPSSQPLMSPHASDHRPDSVHLPLDAIVPPINPQYGSQPPPYDPHLMKMLQ